MKTLNKPLLSFLGLTILIGIISVDASASQFGMRRVTGAVATMAMQEVPLFATSFRHCSSKLEPWKNLPMDATVRDVRYDEAFKILLGEEGRENRPISFLNAIFAPKEADDKIQKVQYLDGSLNSAVDRTLHFDIKIEALCETFSGQRFIIEMQKARIPGHMNRWLYYGARELAMMGERNYKRALEIQNNDDRKKEQARHYQRLDPVKVVTLLDFDNPTSGKELCNAEDIVVHWNVCESQSKQVASNLLSWTYVILPRFEEKLKKNGSLDFRGKPLDAWLYLMTRGDEELVRVTANMTNNDSALAEAFYRISHLSNDERELLHAGKMAYMSRMSREEEKFEQGEAKAKIDMVKKMITQGMDSTVIASISEMSPKQIEEIRAGLKIRGTMSM